MNIPLIQVDGLSVVFLNQSPVVSDVSFSLEQKETLAIVGESGSGKSITALSLLRLLPFIGAQQISGNILFQGKNITEFSSEKMREVRGKEIALIFQDPFATFNPLQSIEKHLSLVLKYRTRMAPKNWRKKMIEILKFVHLPDPQSILPKYPHECSGGMLQRIMIAMAILQKPKVIIADEITTALDATVQKKIVHMLLELQKTVGFALIFITHDLPLASNIASYILVMDSGKIVERGGVQEIFYSPQSDCTKNLIRSLPKSLFAKHNAS